MHNDDTVSWMRGAGDRSIRVALMTAEDLCAKNKPLDAREAEKLHWCWETIESVKQSRLSEAHLAAHKAAHAPMTMEAVSKQIDALEAKIDSVMALPDSVTAALHKT